jgi:hypothetical protein
MSIRESVRFEVFTAVTIKSVVFWDIKTLFIPHRRHITSLLQSPVCKCYVRVQVFTAVTINNTVFSDVTPCGGYKNRRFGGSITFSITEEKISELGAMLSATT